MSAGKSRLGLLPQNMQDMKDPRWTIDQRLEQYRAIVEVQKRDQLVLKDRMERIKRTQERQLTDLRADAKKKQDELRKAMHYSEQNIYKIFVGRRRIQMAFDNKPPSELVEHMTQEAFNKRKFCDRLSYKKEKLMSVYKESILDKDKLDQILMTYKSGIKTLPERKLQSKCSEVQNAKMRTIAAIALRDTYKQIVAILNKDGRFYDSVLDSFDSDAREQSNMLIVVTEMGQLVTENVDDLSTELFQLNADILTNLTERRQNIDSLRNKFQKLNAQSFIRNDSDVNVRKPPKPTRSEVNLLQELKTGDALMEFIRRSTGSTSDNEIYPRLREQEHMAKVLNELRDQLTNMRQYIAHRLIHIEFVYLKWKHNYNHKKIRQLEKEREILLAIRHKQKDCESYRERIADIGRANVKIKHGMKNLVGMLKPVRLSDDDEPFDDEIQPVRHATVLEEYISQFMATQQHKKSPTVEIFKERSSKKIDAMKLIDAAEKKFRKLLDSYAPNPEVDRPAEKFYQREIACVADNESVIDEIDLLEGVVVTDRYLPTHSSVRLASERHVQENRVDELALVAAQVAARKRPGRKFYNAERAKMRKARTARKSHGMICR